MERDRGKKLAINTIIIGIGNMSTQIISFFLLPLYTSILTTEEYGIYDLIVTISTFLLPAITLLMEESMFRFLIDCKDSNDRKKVISQTTIYILISSIIFLVIANILNLFFKIPYMFIGIIYIITCIISALRNSILRGIGEIKSYTIINFISSIVNIVLKVLLIAVFRFGVYGLLVSGIIANLLSSIIVFIKIKLYRYISIKAYNKELMKSMIKYSIPLVPNSVSWSIVNLSDRLVISSFIGTAANGIYSMAYKFPNLMNTIYGFFYTAWKESSAKAVKDEDVKEFFNKIFKMLANMMFAVSICMITCMPLFFSVFIKEAYNEAYLYIPILVIAMYYNNMSGYYGGIFSGYKDTKIMGMTTIIGAIINILVDLLLIKVIGVYAAAISTLVSCAIVYYYRKQKVKKYVKIESEKLIVGKIILLISLVLYYRNSNFIVKVLNLLIVVIYSIYINREVIGNIISEVQKKILYHKE